MDLLHHEGRFRLELVERQQGEDRLGGVGRGDAVEPDHLAAHGLGGEIGVHDGDLVAVAHGTQDIEQVRAEYRIDQLQQGVVLQIWWRDT